MGAKTRAHVIIRGRVQGVFFRLETKSAAEQEGVTGWIRNRPDGAVEAVFEGEKRAVAAVIQWCHAGPALSRVDNVEVAWEDYGGEFAGFKITY